MRVGPENGGGPSPEDIEPVVAPEPTEAPPAAEIPAAEPETRPGFFGRLGERIRDNRERAEIQSNINQGRDRQIKRYAEIIKHGARTPLELQEVMANISFRELRDAEQRVKYGAGVVGKLRAFMAGERDFEISDNGAIADANILKEAGRRLISTFGNKRTAFQAGMYLGLGALTGGLGWAAGGVMFGGMAGRGLAEMGELFSGRTRDARESILYAERARWERMQALALEIQSAPDDQGRQINLAHQLVELLHRQGENVLIRDIAAHEKTLAEREEKFTRVRDRLQTVGELAGGALGLTSILNGGVEHLTTDGDLIFHGVQQANDSMQYLYSSGAEAGKAVMDGAHILAGGQFGAHALTGKMSEILLYTLAERTAPMLLASALAHGGHIKRGRELLSRMGVRQLDPESFYTKPGPDGKRFLFTREEDGTYKRWEWQETEEKDGEKTKKVRKLVSSSVSEDEVPKVFRERFVDLVAEDRTRKAERLHQQIGTAAEYIRQVADTNHSPVPVSPRGYEYNWNEQPVTIDVENLEADHWYLREEWSDPETGRELPEIDPNTGKVIEVAVLGVDVDNNRIAYARSEQVSNGATHVPVTVDRLDHFLHWFRLHLDNQPGLASAPSQTPGNPPLPGPPPIPGTPNPPGPRPPQPTPPAPQPGDPRPMPPRIPIDKANDLEEQLKRGLAGGDGKTTTEKNPKINPDIERTKAVNELVTSLSELDPSLLEMAGISVHKMYTGKSHESYEKRVLFTDTNLSKHILTIPYKNGVPNITKAQISYMPSEGGSASIERYNSPSLFNIQKFADRVATLLETASDYAKPTETPAAAADAAEEAPKTEPIDPEAAATSSTEKPVINPALQELIDRNIPGLENLPGTVIKLNTGPRSWSNSTSEIAYIKQLLGVQGDPEQLELRVDHVEPSSMKSPAVKGGQAEVRDYYVYFSPADAPPYDPATSFPQKISLRSLLHLYEAPVVEEHPETTNNEPASKPIETATAPKSDLERLKIDDVSDLEGKEVKIRDPQGLFMISEKVRVVSGELNPDHISSKTKFAVEAVDNDEGKVFVRANGALLEFDKDELLSNIGSVAAEKKKGSKK